MFQGKSRAEVKQVVWHEVAHWLGKDEEGVKELGLSSPIFNPGKRGRDVPEAPAGIPVQFTPAPLDSAEETNDQPRCIHCYSADVVCKVTERPLSYAFDPVTVHTKYYSCNSCGYEWDDDD